MEVDEERQHSTERISEGAGESGALVSAASDDSQSGSTRPLAPLPGFLGSLLVMIATSVAPPWLFFTSR